MSNSDQASYNVRFNELLQLLEYSAGLNWLTVPGLCGTGITQLTGPVTAGPGSGSQATTITATGVTPGSYTSTNLTVNAAGQITAASSGSGFSPTPSVQFRSTATFASTSNTFVATGTKITGFALSNSAHKVKISVAAEARFDSAASGDMYITIFRDGTTNLGSATTGLTQISYSAASQATSAFPLAVLYLDAPGNTSAHTYEVYIRSDDSSNMFLPSSANGATMIVEEAI